MPESSRPFVSSVDRFLGVQIIDGGDTVAVQFQAPDGRDINILVPRQAALALQANLFDVLSQPFSRDRHER